MPDPAAPLRNLGSLFRQTVERFPDKPAFLFKSAGRYESYSWADIAAKVDALSSFFIERGLQKNDCIAILAENSPEWATVDLAAQRIGVATVPIYTSLMPAEIDYLLKDSGAKLLAVSSRAFLEKIFPIWSGLPELKTVLGFADALSLSQTSIGVPILLMRDAEKTRVHPELNSKSAAVEPDTVASIIYTSGTTGVPKGALLTHSNFIHNVAYSRVALKMGEKDVHLSFLPLSHVFERMAGHYLMIHLGATIAYAESMDTVSENLVEIRPTFVLGVPRFYEKIHEKLAASLEKAPPIQKSMIDWAVALGKRKMRGSAHMIGYGIQDFFADRIVRQKFRKRLGGRVRFCISGSAPLAVEIAEFFYGLGVQIYEGYGLTETSPVISVNREAHWKFGTVGIPLTGVEVRIADDGEILTKSACVMKGYHKKPAESAEALKDGWFHTGDLGKIDSEGFLSITGRKKEIIVTSGGKKVSPRPIEEVLEKDVFIQRAILFGEGKKFLTALIVPAKQALIDYANSQKMAYSSYAELLKNPRIYEAVDARVQAAMADFASFEKIKYFAMLENDFSQEAGEITPTLKVKRDVVLARYKDALLGFYSRETAL